jgi:hypothetical protein
VRRPTRPASPFLHRARVVPAPDRRRRRPPTRRTRAPPAPAPPPPTADHAAPERRPRRARAPPAPAPPPPTADPAAPVPSPAAACRRRCPRPPVHGARPLRRRPHRPPPAACPATGRCRALPGLPRADPGHRHRLPVPFPGHPGKVSIWAHALYLYKKYAYSRRLVGCID